MSLLSFLRSGYHSVQNLIPRILTVEPLTGSAIRQLHSVINKQCFNQSSCLPWNQNKATSLLKINSPVYNSFCGLKYRVFLKRRCKDCYFVTRQERLFVMCKTHPRHKQAQIKKKVYKTWILTFASQSKKRLW